MDTVGGTASLDFAMNTAQCCPNFGVPLLACKTARKEVLQMQLLDLFQVSTTGQ